MFVAPERRRQQLDSHAAISFIKFDQLCRQKTRIHGAHILFPCSPADSHLINNKLIPIVNYSYNKITGFIVRRVTGRMRRKKWPTESDKSQKDCYHKAFV